MNIIIVEDELIIAEMMTDMLHELGYKVLSEARNYEEAKQYLSDEVDLVLIDINLGGKKDGIDLARYINENHQIPFIFVTSNADAATVNRAKEEQPFGYLQKPFDQDGLYSSIEVALINYQRSKKENNTSNPIIKDSIFIKDGHLFVKISFSDLLFVKSDGNYLEIQTPQKKYLIRSSMKEFAEKFPEGMLVHTHRSYMVNLAHVEGFGGNVIILKGYEIPLAKQWKEVLIGSLVG